MTYVALLRGINVGGNNIIKMADLKACFEKNGFTDVVTYIQSGNVIFSSPETKREVLENHLESILKRTFNYNATVLVRSKTHMEKIIRDTPKDWTVRKDIRCYVAFIKSPTTAQMVCKETVLKPGIDFIKAGDGVVYMTTLMSGVTKSGFTKLIGKKIYQNMTMRNFNTTQKIMALMNN